MKHLTFSLIFMIVNTTSLFAQPKAGKYNILMDIAHGQKFWNDPDGMVKNAGNDLERVKYMTSQIEKTASSVDASIDYLKSEIKANELANCDLLFIHIPSNSYSPHEIQAVEQYVKKGGSLFLVMDVDYWSTLEQANVNDLIKPFNIQFGSNSLDTLSGGYTKSGIITDEPLKITYHGGRIVKGGIPFCFNNQTEEYPFGTYRNIKNGGKVVVMGDGMVSLYMTSWKDINDYQCQEFMHAVFQWLLE